MDSLRRLSFPADEEIGNSGVLSEAAEVAKWMADEDLVPLAGRHFGRIPRGYILLGLAIVGWAAVFGIVFLVRVVIGH